MVDLMVASLAFRTAATKVGLLAGQLDAQLALILVDSSVSLWVH